MTIKKLLESTGINLQDILVELPLKVFKANSYGGPKTREVYIISIYANGAWVKENPKTDRIYPITPITVKQMLEWKIIDKKYENKTNKTKRIRKSNSSK